MASTAAERAKVVSEYQQAKN
ncbi:MAG: hypothetical protein RL626_837, partial [Pseudomonadota bacterium]